jgi:phage gp29-like protein
VAPTAVTVKAIPSARQRRVLTAHQMMPFYRLAQRKLEVDGILTSHATGDFRRPAGFVDELMTDDRISGVVETRIGAILSADLEIAPSADKRKNKRVAGVIGGMDGARGLWCDMVGQPVAFEILKWGLMLGASVSQIVWDTVDGTWTPRLVPWDMEQVRWDWTKRRFVTTTVDGQDIDLPRPDEQPYGDGHWFVFCPRGVAKGWLNGMVRSLGELYIMRRWNYRDFARYCEKLGLGIIKGIVPADAKEDEIDDFARDVANIGNEAAVFCPQDETGHGYDLGMVEAVGRGWEAFQAFKETIDRDIAVRVLGQNLTTEISDNGSRAASQTHDLVRLDKALEDAQLGEAFTRQLLSWWAQYEYGDRALAPLVKYHVEPATDLAKEAGGLKILGDALIALKTASPRVNVIAILEAQGVPLISEEEIAAQEAEEAEQATEEEPPPDAEETDDQEDDSDASPAG